MQLNFKKVDSSNGNTNAGDILFVNNDRGIYIVESDGSKTKYGGSEYTSFNKLSADFIEDGSTNKVITETEKTEWNNKQPGNLIVVAGEDVEDYENTKTTNYSVSDVYDEWQAGRNIFLQWGSLFLPLAFISSGANEIAIYCLTVAADDSLNASMPTCVLTVVQRNNTATYKEYDFNSVAFTGETDPVFTASAAYGITATDITNWNNKVSNVQADWNATSGLAQILNKPTIPSTLDQIADGNTRKLSDYYNKVSGISLTNNTYPQTEITYLRSGTLPYTTTIKPDGVYIDGYGTLDGLIGDGSCGTNYLNGSIEFYGLDNSHSELYIPYNKTGVLATLDDIPNEVTESTVSGWGYLKANDVSTKADKSAAISSLSLNMDSTTYTVTLSGTMADGSTFTVNNPIDLPLESVVVNGSYNNSTKKVVLTLQNGNTVEFSVADLVAGLQSEITTSNKLASNLIVEADPVFTASAAYGISASDITNWNNKVSNVQSDWNATTGAAVILNKPTIPTQTTDASVSGWGYIKSYTESDPVFTASAAYDITAEDMTFWNNKSEITSIKMNGSAITPTSIMAHSYEVDLGTVITSHATHKLNATNGTASAVNQGTEITYVESVSGTTTATSGDLSVSTTRKKVTIPTAVTESTVSGWGFTKNEGTLTSHATHKLNATNGTASAVNQGTEITYVESIAGTATATSGDLSVSTTRKKITVPAAANNGTLTIKKNGTSVGTFSANASADTSVNITVNELPTVSGSDNGKILQVVNGQWTLVTPVSIYNGSGEPSNILGNNGDIYIQS